MELYPIAYRDIYALVDVGGLSPDAIHDWFVRYRKSKGKTMDVPPLALRASWNAFVRLWNEGRIREKVERWEASQRKYSLSTLREEVHRLATIRRRVCLADVLEGCRECASTGVPNGTMKFATSLEQSHEAFREEIRAWRRDRAPTEEPARKRQRSDAGSCREDDGRARREDPPQGPPPAGIA
ncbi:hypothetical protein ATCC90586_011373 [Pythium insidiosum]|nr:hypothetical protein ATCC90586_011373 [Pythium insidiosum]